MLIIGVCCRIWCVLNFQHPPTQVGEDSVADSLGWLWTRNVAEEKHTFLILLPLPPKYWDNRKAPSFVNSFIILTLVIFKNLEGSSTRLFLAPCTVFHPPSSTLCTPVGRRECDSVSLPLKPACHWVRILLTEECHQNQGDNKQNAKILMAVLGKGVFLVFLRQSLPVKSRWAGYIRMGAGRESLSCSMKMQSPSTLALKKHYLDKTRDTSD